MDKLIIGIVGRAMFLEDDAKPWDNRRFITSCFKSVAEKTDVIFLPVFSVKYIDEIARLCDGLIVPGTHWNISPKHYGEDEEYTTYDQYEADKKAISAFYRLNKPILGICGGHQSINVFFGGTLLQHTEENHHGTTHDISIKKSSLMYEIYKQERIEVNSYHYQCIRDVAPGFTVCARSDDGVIEAIERDNIIAVQYHPEALENMDFFRYFFGKIKQTHKVKCEKTVLGIMARMGEANSGSFRKYLFLMNHFFEIANNRDIILLPIITAQNVTQVEKMCDGLIVTGFGPNILPSYYGEKPWEGLKYNEETDEFALDKEVIPQFVRTGKPVFGICGGMQSINVLYGGTLTQQIAVEPHLAQGNTQHELLIIRDSFLDDVYNAKKITVNTYHGQAVKTVAPSFRVAGVSHDGVIEAIESLENNIHAVQWHPEVMGDYKLFDWFVESCK